MDEDSKLILDKLFQNAFARSDERLSDFVEVPFFIYFMSIEMMAINALMLLIVDSLVLHTNDGAKGTKYQMFSMVCIVYYFLK